MGRKKIFLNFGAVYYESEIFIDGKFVARHYGGSDSFGLDVTAFLQPGTTHQLVVQAKSDLRSGLQAAGKQSLQLNSWGCNYTRTTGIWQTVWMEAVEEVGLQQVVIVPDIDQKQLIVTPSFHALKNGYKLVTTVKEGTRTVTKKRLRYLRGYLSYWKLRTLNYGVRNHRFYVTLHLK